MAISRNAILKLQVGFYFKALRAPFHKKHFLRKWLITFAFQIRRQNTQRVWSNHHRQSRCQHRNSFAPHQASSSTNR